LVLNLGGTWKILSVVYVRVFIPTPAFKKKKKKSMNVAMSVGAHKGQKRALAFPELKLQVMLIHLTMY